MEEPKVKTPNNHAGNQSKTEENGLTDFIWKTFVGNKKKEDFFRSTIYLLLIINGLFAFFLYSQKTQKAVYVIDAGVPKMASLVDQDVRVDQQVVFFLKLWMKLLAEVSGDNYEDNRKTLKTLSSRDMMQRVLASESSTANRLVKEIIQSETTQLKIVDIVVDEIRRRGSLIEVRFNEVIQIDVPSGSEKYVTNHTAKIITTNYDLNGIGLAMIDLDNLWKLQRRI